jgi:hypothetical protein
MLQATSCAPVLAVRVAAEKARPSSGRVGPVIMSASIRSRPATLMCSPASEFFSASGPNNLDSNSRACSHIRIRGHSHKSPPVLAPAMLRAALCITPISDCRCPLWVKSRHRGTSNQCPLYPQKRTFAAHLTLPRRLENSQPMRFGCTTTGMSASFANIRHRRWIGTHSQRKISLSCELPDFVDKHCALHKELSAVGNSDLRF